MMKNVNVLLLKLSRYIQLKYYKTLVKSSILILSESCLHVQSFGRSNHSTQACCDSGLGLGQVLLEYESRTDLTPEAFPLCDAHMRRLLVVSHQTLE